MNKHVLESVLLASFPPVYYDGVEFVSTRRGCACVLRSQEEKGKGENSEKCLLFIYLMSKRSLSISSLAPLVSGIHTDVDNDAFET